MLGSFNNWNIIKFTNKKTLSELFDAVHKLVLDGISNNMASLVQLGKYGSINTADPTTMGYYVIEFLSVPYTLQEDQTTYGQFSKSGELVVKSEYHIILKSKTNWYWQQHRTN